MKRNKNEEKRVIFISSNIKHLSFNLSLALNCANGFYIARIDSGDFAKPNRIQEQLNCFKKDKIPAITTPIYKLKAENIHNPNVVKTLLNNKNQAIYFSRSAIPHIRGIDERDMYVVALLFVFLVFRPNGLFSKTINRD